MPLSFHILACMISMRIFWRVGLIARVFKIHGLLPALLFILKCKFDHLNYFSLNGGLVACRTKAYKDSKIFNISICRIFFQHNFIWDFIAWQWRSGNVGSGSKHNTLSRFYMNLFLAPGIVLRVGNCSEIMINKPKTTIF